MFLPTATPHSGGWPKFLSISSGVEHPWLLQLIPQPLLQLSTICQRIDFLPFQLVLMSPILQSPHKPFSTLHTAFHQLLTRDKLDSKQHRINATNMTYIETKCNRTLHILQKYFHTPTGGGFSPLAKILSPSFISRVVHTQFIPKISIWLTRYTRSSQQN